MTPIFVYTSYPEAELFINGKSQGRQRKDRSITINATENAESFKNFARQKRYRLMWMDTKYEPGTVKVVAYDDNGKAVAEKEIRTAGKPYALRLSTESKTELTPNSDTLAFITVEAVDKDGNLCPTVNDLVTFTVKGAGFYKAGANGDPTCTDQFHLPKMHLFNGKLVIMVQAGDKSGIINIEAKTKKLKEKIDIMVR